MDDYNFELTEQASRWLRKAKNLKSLNKGLKDIANLATDEAAKGYILNLSEAWRASGGNVGPRLFDD